MHTTFDANAIAKASIEPSLTEAPAAVAPVPSGPAPLEDAFLAYVGGGTGGNNIL